MSSESASSSPEPQPASTSRPAPWSRRRKGVLLLGALLVGYLTVAYLVMPTWWKRYTHRHPSLEDVPHVTHTATGIPGDPLNVALIGTRQEVMRIMVAARWYPADPLTLRSCLQIAEATVLKRPYESAPVSNLFLWGRKEDLAFEQPVGHDPRQRHHVRFWKAEEQEDDGRPLWVGAATFDRKVGLSRTTGQITHHIASNVDVERDHLFGDLEKTGDLEGTTIVKGFHQTREGKNGGGDRWDTDGNLYLGTIARRMP